MIGITFPFDYNLSQFFVMWVFSIVNPGESMNHNEDHK